jgi:hypothetical protein
LNVKLTTFNVYQHLCPPFSKSLIRHCKGALNLYSVGQCSPVAEISATRFLHNQVWFLKLINNPYFNNNNVMLQPLCLGQMFFERSTSRLLKGRTLTVWCKDVTHLARRIPWRRVLRTPLKHTSRHCCQLTLLYW